MAEFLYTPNPKNVADFFAKMKSIGIPQDKLTVKSIAQYGFTSSSDRYLIGVLKTLGFLSADNMPTGRWTDYRSSSKRGFVMAQAVREAYSGLFATYEDAYRKDDEAAIDYFRANSKAGEQTIGYMLKTFRNLCALADFEAAPVPEKTPVSEAPMPGRERAKRISEELHGPTVNINIQLTIPVTEDESVYDKLFASLKKNFPLLG